MPPDNAAPAEPPLDLNVCQQTLDSLGYGEAELWALGFGHRLISELRSARKQVAQLSRSLVCYGCGVKWSCANQDEKCPECHRPDEWPHEWVPERLSDEITERMRLESENRHLKTMLKGSHRIDSSGIVCERHWWADAEIDAELARMKKGDT